MGDRVGRGTSETTQEARGRGRACNVSVKKRRALELEKEAEEWTAPSGGSNSKVRLGKRYQASLPELRSVSQEGSKRTNDPEDGLDSTTTTDEELIGPRHGFSTTALQGVADLNKYLEFATSLCSGYVHGTSHAVTAQALQILHQHNNNVQSAACYLYASHAYPSLENDDDESDQKKLKPKHQEWLVKFFSVFSTPSFSEDHVETLRSLGRSCPLGDNALELDVLRFNIERIEDWKANCEAALHRKCTQQELNALLYKARDVRCEKLSEALELATRLEAFALARARLFEAMDFSVKGKKPSKINLDKLRTLLHQVQSFHVAFPQEASLEAVIADAEQLHVQVEELLAQDKVSVPAIRQVLARVEALPVDLNNIVEPLKDKMVSAQKWLERARKCMPPTKRQSSRIAVDGSKGKMDLDAVHELVKNAPVDEASSEMQEMEELLAYAEGWSQKVQDAMADPNVSVETLKEYLEEGMEMPVVMELTTGLSALIDAHEWKLSAEKATEETLQCTLEELQDLLDEAKSIRERLPSADTWKPEIEQSILANVTAAEAWLGNLQELLGTALWTKLFPQERPKGNKQPTKAPLEALAAALQSPPNVDLSGYTTPLQNLLDRGVEIRTACADAVANVEADDAYAKATALLETIDAFPCSVELGEELRGMVTTAKDWLTRVRAICSRQGLGSNNRRLTKKNSATTTLNESNQVTLDELRELQSTQLAFRFRQDQELLAAELANVQSWSDQVQKVLAQDMPAALAACEALKAIDLQRKQRRESVWSKRREDVLKSPMQVEVPVINSTNENAVEDVETKVEPIKNERPEEKATSMGDAIVQVIQSLSGCRIKGVEGAKKTESTVDWAPIIAQLEHGIAFIAALDAKAKQEDNLDDAITDEDDEKREAEAQDQLNQWKAQLTTLLASSNDHIATDEAMVLSTLLKAIDWLDECRPIYQGDVNSTLLPKLIEMGTQLQNADFPSWFDGKAWTSTVFWPLELLESQRSATKEWLANVEDKISQGALDLTCLEMTLLDGESVQADDRFIWQELKKAKAWLLKAKKAIRAKQKTKLAMHTMGSLVDEGAKCKIRLEAWTLLQANYNAAVAWEAKLKGSGLDTGHAKIAFLVDLLKEYHDAHFLVDLEMHRDVVESATEQYCICRQPYDGFMIGCELCDDWFHDTCVGISKEKAEKVDNYVCPSCSLLEELKSLVQSAQDGSRQLFESEEKNHEKSFGLALRKLRREERDVEKAQMSLLEVQAQVTAIGQHVQYLEKMVHEEPKQPTLPSISIPLHPHHHQPSTPINLFKGYQPILRTFPSPATSSTSQPPFLQPMPPPPPTPTLGPTLPPLKEVKPPDVVSAQEIEITRFKMEHYKLKQMASDAESSLHKGKERLGLARAALDALVTNHDVLLPKAQQWWQQVHVVLSQFLVEKDRFDRTLLVHWAAECQDFQDKFAAIAAMQKVLLLIPWTIEAFALLHGHPKPSYDALDAILRKSLHESKVLLPLKGVLQRTDQWKSRTQKSVAKLLSAKKIDVAKIQVFLNEYLKMPLTCAWGQKLESLLVELETRDPLLPPPTLDITPPSSPVLKRKSSKSSTTSSKKAKSDNDVDVGKKARAVVS
ncbi:unnamed protein product [Aphanomyces euteiches]